ncbi:aminoglycoside phosphotransferase family protein [Actinopolymorpha alba]|uniref:aminoglycoside phosphotransferase family protein n=1 Tax=Actinopolymorpha alba TaxID=533267 RepID=UPI00035FC293|nr:aminoglycoside phosphotransferase family protein [Actinopolymorpha alba]
MGSTPAGSAAAGTARGSSDTGQVLPGGQVGGAVRVGATVRRPAGPWTPTIHELLTHLRAHGLGRIPEPLGMDADGREVLSYIRGRTVGDAAWPDWAFSDLVLTQTMRWLARYHEVVRTFVPTAPRWRAGVRPLEPGEIVCHNDVAPYNLVVEEDPATAGVRVVGVLDWDVAGPGRPMDDVAFAAWNFVPLFQPAPVAEVARRLCLLAEAYAGVEMPEVRALEVLAAVPERLGRALTRIRAGAAAGDSGMARLVSVGQVARTERRLAALTRRMPIIEAAVRRMSRA